MQCPHDYSRPALSFRSTSITAAGTGFLGIQVSPDATALTDGRFVITYQSDFHGSGLDEEAVFRLLNSDVDYNDLFDTGQFQGQPAAAPLANGAFGIVFTNERHADNGIDANPFNITYKPMTASGSMGAALAIGDFNAGNGTDSLTNRTSPPLDRAPSRGVRAHV